MLSRIRYSIIALVSLWAGSVLGAHGHQDLLRFTSGVTSVRGMTVGEVMANGNVIMRFRTTTGAPVGERARSVAQRLHQKALEGIAAAQIVVAKQGSSVQIRAGEDLLVTPDTQTARLSHCSRSQLAAQWAEHMAAAFAFPYLAVDLQGQLRVPVEEMRRIRYGGHIGEAVGAESSDPEVAAVSVDTESQILVVTGKSSGEVDITVSAGPVAGDFPVVCRRWAGHISVLAEAEVTGPRISPQIAQQAVLNAILSDGGIAPGARVSVERLEEHDQRWRATVQIAGQGYFTRRQQVMVRPKLLPWDQKSPTFVLVSNRPEKVSEPGVLLRQRLAANQTSRLLWHHDNGSAGPLTFTVSLLNTTDVPGRVHLLGDTAGPGRDEIHLGHMAMYRFWQALTDSAGYVAVIPPGKVWHLYQQPTPGGQLVSGLAQLTNVGSTPLLVEVSAQRHPSPLPLTAVEARETDDLPLTDFQYPASRQLSAAHTVSGPWTFVHIGKGTAPDQLPGDYGVTYHIDVEVTNPLDEVGHCEIAVIAAGGVARGLYLIGEQLVHTGLLRPNQEKLLYHHSVPAHSTISVPIKTIPQSGSNYPVTLIVRSSSR